MRYLQVNSIAGLIIFLLVFGISYTIKAQTLVYTFTEFENRIKQDNDTLYVVNFWATWCKPCIEELPHFEKAAQELSNQPVKIILVSLDAKSRVVQVNDFIRKNNYTSEFFILSAGNPNVWIDKVEPDWSGAIPMTTLYKQQKKIYFYEGDYATYELLKSVITSHLN